MAFKRHFTKWKQELFLSATVPNQKQLSCKKMCGPCCEKRCEIQGGGQEMAVMVG